MYSALLFSLSKFNIYEEAHSDAWVRRKLRSVFHLICEQYVAKKSIIIQYTYIFNQYSEPLSNLSKKHNFVEASSCFRFLWCKHNNLPYLRYTRLMIIVMIVMSPETWRLSSNITFSLRRASFLLEFFLNSHELLRKHSSQNITPPKLNFLPY